MLGVGRLCWVWGVGVGRETLVLGVGRWAWAWGVGVGRGREALVLGVGVGVRRGRGALVLGVGVGRWSRAMVTFEN